MPATAKPKMRDGPYDRPEEKKSASLEEAPAESEQERDARLMAAIQQAVPQKPKTQNHLDFRTLTPEVLAACLKMQEPKQVETCLMAFTQFDVKKYCEMTGIPLAALDLKKYANGNMCILTPFARMPFGVSSNFTDEKTGKPKYLLTFSLYNPDCQQDLDDLQTWIDGPFRDRMLDLVSENLLKWGEDKPNKNPEVQRAILESMWYSPIKASTDPKYKDNLNVKIKSMTNKDEPVLQVWNQKTQGSVGYNQVQQGDYGSAFVFFEGLTKVGGKFYPRVFTRAMIYCDPVVSSQADQPLDDAYPLPEPALVG